MYNATEGGWWMPQMLLKERSTFPLYGYYPNVAAAVVFVVMFGLTSAVHFAQLLYYRQWWMLVMLVGTLAELGHHDPFVRDPYVAMECLLIITPCLFAAVRRFLMQVHFTSIGRIATLFPRKYSVVRPILLVPIFVTIDIASLVVQGVGAASAATADNEHDSHNGSMVVVAGVAVQLAGYLLFNMAFLSFWYRVRKDRPPLYIKLRTFMAAVFFSSLFIVLRSIYRVIEMAYGWEGSINTTEWAMYVFDGVFVLIAVVILNVYNPMRYLPKRFSWKFDPERDGPADMESAVPEDRHASDTASQEKGGMDTSQTDLEDGGNTSGAFAPQQGTTNKIDGSSSGAYAPTDMSGAPAQKNKPNGSSTTAALCSGPVESPPLGLYTSATEAYTEVVNDSSVPGAVHQPATEHIFPPSEVERGAPMAPDPIPVQPGTLPGVLSALGPISSPVTVLVPGTSNLDSTVSDANMGNIAQDSGVPSSQLTHMHQA